MKLLINFSTLKAGGGQNVAMNFLYAIDSIDLKQINLYYIVADDSQIHKFLETNHKQNYFVVSQNPIKRILFELFQSKNLLKKWKIDIIYSYFGYGLFPKGYKQVIGSADSNLYFPDIDFWKGYNGTTRLKKYLVDFYRLYGVKNSNAVVFENEVLEKKAKELYNLKNTITIKPSINMVFKDQKYLFSGNVDKNIPKGLFLCGWHMNKNILKIPEIAYNLKKMNVEFQFILTAPIDNTNSMYIKFIELSQKYDVLDRCFVIGQINKEQLKSLYEQVDYVFLLSKLESFSNNIIESWYFKKLLIISDEEWAHSICKNAAFYVNRDDSKLIASDIKNLLIDKEKVENIIQNGGKEILFYPNIETRIKLEMEYIENVYKNN